MVRKNGRAKRIMKTRLAVANRQVDIMKGGRERIRESREVLEVSGWDRRATNIKRIGLGVTNEGKKRKNKREQRNIRG